MNINILQLSDGAKQAEGLTIVIDVFRAFSTACYLFEAGVSKILPVQKIEEALELKRQFPDAILLGERSERKVPGFDLGNSPSHIANFDLKGKTVIMTTSSGTKGIAFAANATEIITGSFVNAGAIVDYIRQKSPAKVSLVAMGYEGRYSTQEDTFLADYIKAKLTNEVVDFSEMVEQLRTGDGARLLDPANHEWSPASDFDLCLNLNKFNFVLRVENENGILLLRKEVLN